MFGNLFRRGIRFLGDTLGKVNKFAPVISQAGKLADSLGVGGGRLGGLIQKGLGFAEMGRKRLKEFEEKSPSQQAQTIGRGLGDLATRFLPGALQSIIG